ncbi:MAG: M28 family peptidase [Clostridia bacterium]
MNFEKQSAEFVYDFVKKVIDTTGPRLPGSEEEAMSIPIITEKMEKATGNKAIVEPFTFAPRASIGAISLLGYFSLPSILLGFISPIIPFVVCISCLVFAIFQIFTYKGVFDFLFKKETSHNVYSTLEPANGEEAEYSIMFSGHKDSSWCWNHSLKNAKTVPIKTGIGVGSVLTAAIISLVRIIVGPLLFIGAGASVFQIVLYVLPLLCIPGTIFLCQYLSWDKTKASPGAMDNLTGVGFSILVANYYKENPDKQPKNCRIICAALDAEEAGLKGSLAFCKQHENDGMLNNLYVVNIDSIRDFEHFYAVKGDLWLGTHFDDNMIKMACESMQEVGRKGGQIYNPVGGCDSTPFCRKGIPTVTMIAQNPVATNYYHTSNDKYEDLDMNTLEKFSTAIIKMSEKVAQYHEDTKK